MPALALPLSRSSTWMTARRMRPGRNWPPQDRAPVAAGPASRAELRPERRRPLRRPRGALPRGDPRRRWAERSRLHPALAEALGASDRIGLAAGQRTGRKDGAYKKWQSRIANGVRGRIRTARAIPAADSRSSAATSIWLSLFRCAPPVHAGPGEREGYEIAHVDVVDRPRHAGRSITACSTGFLSASSISSAWWLLRRRRHVPQARELNL